MVFILLRGAPAFPLPGEGSDGTGRLQGTTGSGPQLLQGQGEVQRQPGRQHDHPVHCAPRPTGQGHQHLLNESPVRSPPPLLPQSFGHFQGLTVILSLQRVVRLPLPGADQNRAGQLNVLPPGPADRQPEGAVGGESGEPGGGGDGQRQGPGYPGRLTQLHG